MLKIFAIALLAVFCSGAPVDDDVNGEGVARQYRIAAEEYFKVVFNRQIGQYDANKVKFFLYTNQEPTKVQLKNEYVQQMLRNSSYDIARTTKILIHDRFFSQYYYKELIAAYLRHFHKPVNVITVDYSYYSGAEHKAFMRVYREIGETIAHFVGELQRYGSTGNKIHVIGHGIGAHIAAVASHKVAPLKFGRITGLCPAGLEFDEDQSLTQLEKHDADFVDVILTNMGELGSNQPNRGHVNFYPHGGAKQPRSNMFLSHLKAYFYYVESVSRGKVFRGYAAESYDQYKMDKYDRTKLNYMGEYVLKNETGNFYLDVEPVPPYSTIVDPKNRPEKVKFEQTYLSWIFGTESWALAPMKDLYPRMVVSHSNAMLAGFGEGRNMRDATEPREKPSHYSTQPQSNNYVM